MVATGCEPVKRSGTGGRHGVGRDAACGQINDDGWHLLAFRRLRLEGEKVDRTPPVGGLVEPTITSSVADCDEWIAAAEAAADFYGRAPVLRLNASDCEAADSEVTY